MHQEDSVSDRFEAITADHSPALLAAALGLGAAIAFALLFLQEPLAHEAAHNFRHGAGITCH